ncbi:hypothetical protein QEC20_005006 [Escherichia coli]|nr:hypothetical protein [Escherichia coli]EHH4810403.1 hypothetical protein [Escherichia coli]EHO1393317.1 hypothetical protein [Escherichia coli]EKR0553383.1 hypothetical protein [Escherichia coli]EKT3545225.1 hypothetical protein [Escherichia coli]
MNLVCCALVAFSAGGWPTGAVFTSCSCSASLVELASRSSINRTPSSRMTISSASASGSGQGRRKYSGSTGCPGEPGGARQSVALSSSIVTLRRLYQPQAVSSTAGGGAGVMGVVAGVMVASRLVFTLIPASDVVDGTRENHALSSPL